MLTRPNVSRRRGLGLGLAVLLFAAVFLPARPAAAAEVVSYALVQPDAALKVSGKIFQLYGLYIPPSGQVCERHIRPTRCGSRAAVALESKIQGFVACRPVRRNPDRSYAAFCRTRFEGEDLGSYLIQEGWALALPHAPFAYHALERIARQHGRGVWGFQVDSITNPRHGRHVQ